MKKLTLAAILSVIASYSSASPYFRLLGNGLNPVAGALIAPDNLGNTEGAALLPAITHSKRDGCLLPTIVCEDWAILAIGASMNAGQITLDLGPIANVVPWVQSAVQSATGWHYIENPSVTISAGPMWEYQQHTNRGYYKTFVGLALSF